MIEPPRWLIMCGSTALRRQERAGEVDVLHALPLGDRDEMHRPATRDTGGGDEDVDAAVARDGVVDDLLLRVRVAHVERVELRGLRRLLDRSPGVGGVDVRTDDDGTLGGEAFCAGETDARRGAGDVRDLALEATHAFSPSARRWANTRGCGACEWRGWTATEADGSW